MSLIEIRPPSSVAEYDQACALVEEVYYEHGITTQRRVRHPKAIFVAVRDGAVLGSVGLRSAAQGTLPAEHYFGFDVTKAYDLPRAAVCEIVKLAAKERTDHTVFRGLVAACAQYTFVERSFSIVLAIVKPTLERALRLFWGIPLARLPYPCVEERAAADYPRYFFEGSAPAPVAFRREDREKYLGQLLAELEGKAIVECGGFDHCHDYSSMGAPARTRQFVATTEIGFNESKNALVETDFASDAPRPTSLEAKMITTKAKSVSHH